MHPRKVPYTLGWIMTMVIPAQNDKKTLLPQGAWNCFCCMLQQHNTQRKHPLPPPSTSGPIQNTIEDVVISSDHKASFEEGVVAPQNPVYAATTSQLLDCDGKWLNFRPTTAGIPSENFYPYPAYELSFWLRRAAAAYSALWPTSWESWMLFEVGVVSFWY